MPASWCWKIISSCDPLAPTDAERVGTLALGPVTATADRLRSIVKGEPTSFEPSKYSESSELLLCSPASISLADRRTDAVGKLVNAADRFVGLRTVSPAPVDAMECSDSGPDPDPDLGTWRRPEGPDDGAEVETECDRTDVLGDRG